MAERDGGGGAFIVGFLLGATAGIAAALMMAPRSGQETLEDIRERGIQLRLRAEELGSETRERAAEQARRVQDTARSQIEELEGKVQSGLEHSLPEVQVPDDAPMTADPDA